MQIRFRLFALMWKQIQFSLAGPDPQHSDANLETCSDDPSRLHWEPSWLHYEHSWLHRSLHTLAPGWASAAVLRIRITRVGDTSYFNEVRYSDPAIHINADPDPAFHFNADPDPAFHFHADPDPAFHFTADPDRNLRGSRRPRLYYILSL